MSIYQKYKRWQLRTTAFFIFYRHREIDWKTHLQCEKELSTIVLVYMPEILKNVTFIYMYFFLFYYTHLIHCVY